MDNEATEEAEALLDELLPMLREQLAADEWGRLLLLLEPGEEGWRVRDLQIEDVEGDEARIEAALRSTGLGPLFGVLLEACEVLCGLEGVELADVEGGTFVRRPGGRLGFLPGIVRTPSDGFLVLCDERLEPTMERQRALSDQGGVTDRYEVDLGAGEMTFLDEAGRPTARARVSLLGSFSDKTRTWAWAWANPSLPDLIQERARDLCDRFSRRDLWELTTAQFATDLGSCWALASLFVVEHGAAGIYRVPQAPHHVFVLLDRLERAGHIRREPSPFDRRALIIIPTAPTSDLHRAILGDVREELVEVASSLTPEDAETVVEFMDRLRDAVDHIDKPAAGQEQARTRSAE